MKFFGGMKKIRAFTIIEALVTLFIAVTVLVTFYSVFSFESRYIIESKNRLGASALAREKMEIIRNLKYANVGTVGGIPGGNIDPEEEQSVNGRKYTVKTLIQYIDDPFDGILPADAVPTDYKRAKVTVSWGEGGNNETYLVSTFVPPGLELLSGEGTLSINVIDGQGAGVPQAAVQIINNNLSPPVNIAAETDNNGNLIFPGARESIQKYQIAVSKSGRETIATLPPYPETGFNPLDVHASVVQGLLNVKNIVQNQTGDLKISSVDQSRNPVGGVGFHAKGGRIIGLSTDVIPAPVYNLDVDSSTDSSGEKTFSPISPGTYYISPTGTAGYNFAGSDPASPFSLVPGEIREMELKMVPDSFISLLAKVSNAVGQPVSGASVALTNAGGYSVSKITQSDGLAFFPDSGTPLVSGEYHLKIEAAGFSTYETDIFVNHFTEKAVNL